MIMCIKINTFSELKSSTPASDTCSKGSSGSISNWKKQNILQTKNGKIKNLFLNHVLLVGLNIHLIMAQSVKKTI